MGDLQESCNNIVRNKSMGSKIHKGEIENDSPKKDKRCGSHFREDRMKLKSKRRLQSCPLKKLQSLSKISSKYSKNTARKCIADTPAACSKTLQDTKSVTAWNMTETPVLIQNAMQAEHCLENNMQSACTYSGQGNFPSVFALNEPDVYDGETRLETSNEMQANASSSELLSSKIYHVKKIVHCCTGCGIFLEDWNLFFHIRDVHERYICLTCKELFPQADYLAEHLITNHSVMECLYDSQSNIPLAVPESSIFICCTCEESFIDKFELIYHSCHPETVDSIEVHQEAFSNNFDNYDVNDASFYCHVNIHECSETDKTLSLDLNVLSGGHYITSENTQEELPEDESEETNNIVTDVYGEDKTYSNHVDINAINSPPEDDKLQKMAKGPALINKCDTICTETEHESHKTTSNNECQFNVFMNSSVPPNCKHMKNESNDCMLLEKNRNGAQTSHIKQTDSNYVLHNCAKQNNEDDKLLNGNEVNEEASGTDTILGDKHMLHDAKSIMKQTTESENLEEKQHSNNIPNGNHTNTNYCSDTERETRDDESRNVPETSVNSFTDDIGSGEMQYVKEETVVTNNKHSADVENKQGCEHVASENSQSFIVCSELKHCTDDLITHETKSDCTQLQDQLNLPNKLCLEITPKEQCGKNPICETFLVNTQDDVKTSILQVIQQLLKDVEQMCSSEIIQNEGASWIKERTVILEEQCQKVETTTSLHSHVNIGMRESHIRSDINDFSESENPTTDTKMDKHDQDTLLTDKVRTCIDGCDSSSNTSSEDTCLRVMAQSTLEDSVTLEKCCSGESCSNSSSSEVSDKEEETTQYSTENGTINQKEYMFKKSSSLSELNEPGTFTMDKNSDAISTCNIEVAGEEIPPSVLSLEGESALPIQTLMEECIKVSSKLCAYCNHAKKIAVNGEQIALHLLAKHRFACNNGWLFTADDFVEKLKTALPELHNVYINRNDGINLNQKFTSSYECFICCFITPLYKTLCDHNRKSHKDTSLQCSMCTSPFYSYSELLFHMCPGKSTEDSMKFQCCLCDVDTLLSAFRLLVHLRKHHCTCEACLEKATDQNSLSKHIGRHKLNHACYRCGIAYRNKGNITKHLFWKHGTESVPCNKCLKKKWPFVYHFCIPPIVFACDDCNANFSRAVALKVHRRLHRDDFRYCCEDCEEKFISRKLLQKHKEKHKPATAIKQAETATVSDSTRKNMEQNSSESDDTNEKPDSIKSVCDNRVLMPVHKTFRASGDNSVKNKNTFPAARFTKGKNIINDPMFDVCNFPPLNLSSDSEEEEEVNKQAVSVPSEKQPTSASGENINIDIRGNAIKDPLTSNDDIQSNQIVEGIWDRFQAYQADLWKEKHPQREETGPVPSKVSSTSEHYISSEEYRDPILDHDYCSRVMPLINKTTPEKTEISALQKDIPLKTEVSSTSSSSANSSSDCDTCCSSSSDSECTSKQALSVSSISDNSMSEPSKYSVLEPKFQKNREDTSPLKHTNSMQELSNDDISQQNGLYCQRTDQITQESDLETDETKSEEDFYELCVLKQPIQLLTEERNQSFPLPSQIQTLEKHQCELASTLMANKLKTNDTSHSTTRALMNLSPNETASPTQHSLSSVYGLPDCNKYVNKVKHKRKKNVSKLGNWEPKNTPKMNTNLKKGSYAAFTHEDFFVNTDLQKSSPENNSSGTNSDNEDFEEKVSLNSFYDDKTHKKNADKQVSQQENRTLYCFCRCPYDEVSEMIACDGKDCAIEWFHFECVGIVIAPNGKWLCPVCRLKESETVAQ